MITTLLGFLSLVISLLLLPFFLLLLVTAVAALRARNKSIPIAAAATSPRFFILVPAHDEAALIAATVANLLSIDYPRDRFQVVVIADNCTDQTAALARAAGAAVWERKHATMRGKGHALEWAIARLIAERRPDGRDAVVIIDADVGPSPGLLTAFAAGLASGYDFAQALYLGLNPDASWRTQLMQYGLALFNGVWLLAQEQLGLSVALRGNGMCFTVAGLRRCPWSAFGLAEDLEFSWRLRLSGERVHFVRAAQISAQLVSTGGAAAASQRQRWEHGRKALRALFTDELLANRKVRPLAKVYYALDLYMVPLSKLAVWQAFAVLCGLAAAWPGLWLLQLLAFASLAIYALTPFMILNLPLRYLLALRFLPAYVLWKLWLAGAAAPRQWVRTGREGDASKDR